MTDPSSRPPLDPTTLRTRVGPPWRVVDVVEHTGSTNTDLLERAASGEDIVGAVLLAEHQSAGRGRHGRQWSAPPRSQLSLSVGIDASAVEPSEWGWLPLLTGVAVVEAVAAVTGVSAGLKWPNDVLVGTGKLAGILAEVSAPQPVIVVGAGINVTLTEQEAPDPRATSLAILGATDVDRTALAAAVLDALGLGIQRWQAAGGVDDALLADYRRLSLTLGSQVKATLPGGGEVVGIAKEFDDAGRLIIANGNDLTTVAAADITHLRAAE